MVFLTPRDIKPVALSFICFFFLLTSYFMLRPVRDEMGVQAGSDQLSFLFSGTFLVVVVLIPVYGALVSKLRNRIFLLTPYTFFLLTLILFSMAAREERNTWWIAPCFFIWLSVFNIFCVSVFWSFLTEVFSRKKASLYFPWIAAGGSAGALIGPAMTALLTHTIGIPNLMALAAACLFVTGACLVILISGFISKPSAQLSKNQTIQGNWYDGFSMVARISQLQSIATFTLLYSFVSTFLYIRQTQLAGEFFSSPADRTVFFARIDLIINLSTIAIQFFISNRLIHKLQSRLLFWVPMMALIPLGSLIIIPNIIVLAVAQIFHRVSHFSITNPVRDMLYTHVDNPVRYRGKYVIDTFIFRGGDATSSWLLSFFGSGGISWVWVVLPGVLGWAWVGKRIAKLDLGPRKMKIMAKPLPDFKIR